MITASSSVTYDYDGLGRDGGPSGAYTDLIYANGSMIAEVPGDQTAVPVYRAEDHLGSLALQTDNSGNVTGSNVFLPFGQAWSSSTTDVYQFTELPQDTENASYHAGYRNFSYQQGRWLSPDPSNGSYDVTNPQSFNRYSYVNNNPMGFIDLTGLDCIYLLGGGWAAVTTGDCGSSGDDGYYVDGTVDVNSLAYNGSYLDFNYTTDDGATGVGAFQINTPDTDIADYSDSLGYAPTFSYTFLAAGPSGYISMSGFTSIAPNNPTPKNPPMSKSQCVAQVQASTQKTRKIIEAAGGLTLENTTAACLFAGPGAPECLAVVDPVVLINTGLILAGEWYNTSQEEAACAQYQ